MARHIAQTGLRQHRRRLVGVAAAAALLAGGSGAVMALASQDAAPTAQAPVPASTTTTAPPTAPTSTAPPKKQPTKKPSKKATPVKRTTTTTPAARAASRTAPAPAKVAPKPKPSPVKTPARATTTTVKPAPAPVSGGVADQVRALVNTERAKAGCGSVRASSTLQRAAQLHSADMAAKNYFSHTSLDGRTFGDRIRAAGYSGGAIAENIAAGQSTASAVMKSWMASSGHRANILNCTYTALGVGYAKGGTYGHYWTQDFGG